MNGCSSDMKTPALALALAALTLSCKKAPPPPAPPPLTAEQKQKVAKLVDAAKALAKELDETRVETVRASKAEPSPAPCPIDWKSPFPKPLRPKANVNSRRAYSAKLLATTMNAADVLNPEGKAQNDGPRPAMANLDEALERHQSLITSGRSTEPGDKAIEALEKDIVKWRDGGDGVLMQKTRVEPWIEGKKVTPGRVVGRFYFLSRKEKRVVCVADVDVTGPRGFVAWGETLDDVARDETQLPQRLTGEAVVEALGAMHAVK